MQDTNSVSILIHGPKQQLGQILFEGAVNCATEFGFNIWYISPDPFRRVPENFKTLDRSTLELFTFMYLKDRKELLNHLTGIHFWHKFPRCIVLNHLEHYVRVSDCVSSTGVAYVVASLLDAARTCRVRDSSSNLKTCVLVSCDDAFATFRYLERTFSLYFSEMVACRDGSSNVMQRIKTCLQDIRT